MSTEPICVVRGWWYTLKAGGYWQGFRVSGHEYGEPVYEVRNEAVWDQVPTEQYIAPVEVEALTCARCGYTSEAWRPQR